MSHLSVNDIGSNGGKVKETCALLSRIEPATISNEDGQKTITT